MRKNCNNTGPNRIESLDYLRGIMALSVMIYHLTYWNLYHPDASTPLGRLGIYAVSIFFILSGLSIAIAYSYFINDLKSSIAFYIRRIFRIWPLLWLCIIAVIIPKFLIGKDIPSFEALILNFTTLFGFMAPTEYINTGAWSIGNEMVYYFLTPFFIYFYRKSLIVGNMLVLLSFFITVYFAFFYLDLSKSLASQWGGGYINPINNLFLYMSGIAIFFNLKDKKFNPFIVILFFLLSFSIFVKYPVHGDQINIVTGYNRLVFILASILLVIAFYMFEYFNFIPKFIRVSFYQLGIATYGVYLLHPIIHDYAVHFLKDLRINQPLLFIVLVSILTVVVSLISWNYFEKKLIIYGKNISKRLLTNGGFNFKWN
jgi:peptidoglycan/LPS O-acetylase OafA/YrhL